MRKMLQFSALALAVLFLIPVAVQAYSYKTTTYGWGDAGPATYGIHMKADDVEYKWTASAGKFAVDLKDDSGNTDWVSAFCIEPNQKAQIGYNINMDVDLVSINTVNGGLQAAWLMEYAEDFSTGYTEKDQMAALQLAIWEVITDTSGNYNLASGDFILYNQKDYTDLANRYLAMLMVNFGSADVNYLAKNYSAGLNPDHQDFILKTGSAVPEPGTLVLVGFGLLGIAAVRRKFHK